MRAARKVWDRRTVLMSLIALTAGGAASANAAAENRIRIEVPSKTNLQFLALWIAIGSGAFVKHGLRPDVIVSPSPRQTGEMLLRGQSDVAVLPPPMFLGMMAESKPIQLFASLLANEPINLVLRETIAQQRNFRSNAPIRDKLLSLSGLKVGLAPEVTPRLRALFAAARLQPETILKMVSIDGPQQVRAFADGKVDMLFAHTPYLETALLRFGAVLVVDASNGEIAGLADGQVHALAATRDGIRRNPQLIQSAARAIADAEQLIHSDPAKSLDALLASGAAGTDRRATATTIAVYSPAVPRDPRISISGIIRDRELYPAHPRAPDFAVVNPAEFVARDFAKTLPELH